ncbi:LSM domain-containing protein [Heterostelium album PN500]|uniref:Small nuclear ribonucleoprotein G n=1 Tax=Heterostelium pallidum (strain ATCC 26659 / Pp 5 / PN500) TaxID=670386 RepID=D3AWW2_HETP5|nr:LSM domain-containing protein [Heterostelium album PN500]EFA86785.1 LSM domain-containing protein [Heterostelium album PN500]|eukprot:XP_020438889.1 LSM domain-containing protein [Heterostelium album PN500]
MVFGKPQDPDLTKLLDKKMNVKLNGNRTVIGILRGFDSFMNIVLKDTVEVTYPQEQINMGMVVIRGNSIVMMEPLEAVSSKK